MLDLNKIYNMDCVEGMKLLDDESVDLTVTSPPYDNLRTYNGFSWDFEATAKEIYIPILKAEFVKQPLVADRLGIAQKGNGTIRLTIKAQ